jgi:MoaA/NifB/PqqE/SkfB family radical SAM enzyme
MNLVKMALSYLNRNQPSYLILFVTSTCNAKCSFCFYGSEVACKDRKKNELTTSEFLRVSKKCGNVPYLLISGGEPVLRDDLFEIIGYFIENAHSQFITVPSNGLSRERSVELFSRLTSKYPKCHFRAAFSIDHNDANHDISRGIDGCLAQVLETTAAINDLKKTRSNLTMDIVSIYLNSPSQNHGVLRKWVRENIGPDNHELHLLRPEWPRLVHDKCEPDACIGELALYRAGSTARENRAFSPFFRGLNDLYIRGLEKVMSGKLLATCTAGKKFTVISETGQVRLCECRDDVLGDLRENDYDLRLILKKSARFIKYVVDNNCTCTWECAVSCNLVCDPAFIPKLILATLKQKRITERTAV